MPSGLADRSPAGARRAGVARVALRSALLVPVLLLAPAGAARAGGSLRAYVQLPASGRLLIVDVGRSEVLRSVPVPAGTGPIAASIDGSRVVVASGQRGIVTELDGIHGRRTHVFRALGRPVDIVLVPRTDVGLVRPRYALVADARGFVDTLDLGRGTVTRRTPVRHPTALALDGGQLFVASSGRSRLTLLDVRDPAAPRVVGHPQAGVVPIALAVDSQVAAGVDAVSADGRVVQLDVVSLAHTRPRTLGTRVTELIAAYRGAILAVARDGRVLRPARARRPARRRDASAAWQQRHARRRLPGGDAGSLAHAAPARLERRCSTRIVLPGDAGSSAFAVT